VKWCDFCDEFAGGSQNAFVHRYSQADDRIVMASACFRIVPTLGQLVAGHLLIVPSRHLCALADLPSLHVDELSDLCRRVRSTLKDVYGECLFFEHGVRGSGSGGCGIDHAHMHAVPVSGDGILGVLIRQFGGRAIHSVADIKKVVGQESYLFFEDSSGMKYVFPVKKLPSQYMRKLVARSIGKADWDWRKSEQEPELISTLERLTPLFSAAAATVGE
jgi:diadenosine tetraphosphate (Ap4A) HIT family hydrolase